jgi:hypothetical protein
VGILIGAATFVFWILVRPAFPLDFAAGSEVVGVAIAVLLVGLSLQAVAHPGYGITSKSMLGFWPKRLTPYIYFSEDISRRRYLFSLLFPFAFLVITPLAGAIIFDSRSGWPAFVSCLGGLAFGPNILLALPALLQVPPTARLAGRGFQPFWRAS